MQKAYQILKKYWKFEDFKSAQKEVISWIMEGHDSIVLMPTGGGKSLCYQIPGLAKEGICLVVSPLIALMQDQANHLDKKGVKSVTLIGSLSQDAIIREFDNLQFGGYKFLFLSPEKLSSEFIQKKLLQLQINLIAIDEAHCISEWGHDFRPAYLKIGIIKNLGINAPMVALTATANIEVLEDIKKHLMIPNAKCKIVSLIRPNISLNLISKEDVYGSVELILKKHRGPTIIYANTRHTVKVFSDHLNQIGFNSTYYHGGLSNQEKDRAFQEWMSETKQIMVATNAFGMGIDKHNVRLVIHLTIPRSIENYMQETGRAGRDGLASTTYLFTNNHLINNLKSQYLRQEVNLKLVKRVYQNLNQYLYIDYGELNTDAYPINLSAFCSHFKLDQHQCFNAIKVLSKEGILTFEERFDSQSTLKVLVNPTQLLGIKKKRHHKLLTLILRTYGGIFDRSVPINETYLSKKLAIKPNQIIAVLHSLNEEKVIDYTYKNNENLLRFNVPREDQFTINKIAGNIKLRLKINNDKLNAMLGFIENQGQCRNTLLLAYFGESLDKPCMSCDVCRKKNEVQEVPNIKQSSDLLLTMLGEGTMSVDELATQLKFNKKEVIPIIRTLLDSHKIKLTSQNKIVKL